MRPPPEIAQLISMLAYHVAAGKAHLKVAKGLGESDPVVLNAANTFFAMAIDANLYSALMYAARIHDTQKNAVTISTLIERALASPGTAKYGTREEVENAAVKAKNARKELEEPLKRLHAARNRHLAHTDPRTISNPTRSTAEVAESARDLEEIFIKTGEIVNEFSRLYQDTFVMYDIIGADDYETVIKYIREGKCEQLKKYEIEFGAPAPFPRPRGCD